MYNADYLASCTVTLHALKHRQYLFFHYLFDSALSVVSLMEEFGIQELNGTAYIKLASKLVIRFVKQLRKGCKFYVFFFFIKY